MSERSAQRLWDAALSLRGKRVVVAGLGLFGGGVAATRFLVEEGADVLVTDTKSESKLATSLNALDGLNIDYKLCGHDRQDFESADLIVANPAIPFRSEFLQAAVSSGVPVTTEIALFFARFPGKTIAVTGTSGKTTTTTLIGHIVANAIPDTIVGGNMGGSLLDSLATCSGHTTAVVELSSFQLRYLDAMRWRPEIGVVTNFSPNHLDIHDDLDDYRACKQGLIVHQSAKDVAILNRDDDEVSGWQTRARRLAFGFGQQEADGVEVVDGRIDYRQDGATRTICGVEDLLIPGKHNQANASAAACAALSAGVSMGEVAEVLATFEGVEHRLERCREVNGVVVYNDSIATSPERTVVALEALERPCILIAGGSDKGLGYATLGAEIDRLAKHVLLIGDTGAKIAEAIGLVTVEEMPDLTAAVRRAHDLAVAGDAVLLSPASASFDMFANFEERGRVFKTLVAKI